MRLYAAIAVGATLVFLLLFLLLQPLLPLTLWTDLLSPASSYGKGAAAVASIAILICDVFLPVPSSLVLIANGQLFGPTLGALVSLAGTCAGAAVAFQLGRLGRGVARTALAAPEHDRAAAASQEWGGMAILLSRPVPLLAESFAIAAGASPMTWPRFLGAAALGNVPPSALLAWAGSTASGASHPLLSGVLVVAAAAAYWSLCRLALRRRAPHRAP